MGTKRIFLDTIYVFLKAIVRLALALYFRVRIEGSGNVPDRGPVILAANHASFLDPLVLGAFLRRRIRFMSRKENFDIPVLRKLIELGGAVPVDRKGGGEGLEPFFDLLRGGEAVAIFPEGAIPGFDAPYEDILQETGLLKGHTGMIRLALGTGSPIVPVGIRGTREALPPEAIPKRERSPFPRPRRISIRFGKPISFEVEKVDYNTLRRLTDSVMEEISRLVKEQ
ncbi:MAG: lysophospholipid acyltransferase family protein [bacterium]